jgi:hypothetical protein
VQNPEDPRNKPLKNKLSEAERKYLKSEPFSFGNPDFSGLPEEPIMSAEIKHRYTIELMANLAKTFLKGTDYTGAAKKAMALLDACREVLDDDLIKQERTASSYAMSLIPDNEALKKITNDENITRATTSYALFDREMNVGKKARIYRRQRKEKGWSEHEIRLEQSRYSVWQKSKVVAAQSEAGKDTQLKKAEKRDLTGPKKSKPDESLRKPPLKG